MPKLALLFLIGVTYSLTTSCLSAAQTAASEKPEGSKIQLATALEPVEQVDESSARPKTYTGADIESLLAQLSSRKFSARESATEELIQIGEKAMKPLGVYFFRGTAESNWRIKRALESISTSGDEAVFLKATGILQLLYGKQNDDIQKQILELQTQWRVTRRKEGIARLTKMGFKIDDAGPSQQWARLTSGTTVQVVPKEEVSKNVKRVDPRKNRRETIMKIEKILENSIESNRKLVLKEASNNNSLDPIAQAIAQRAQVLNSAIVTTPARWTPDDKTLSSLLDIAPISQLTIKTQTLTAKHLELVQQLDGLVSLTLNNCEIDKASLKKVGFPKTLRTFSLSEMTLDGDLIRQLSQVQSLGLDNCQIDNSTIASVEQLKNVRAINFSNVTFSKASFDKIMRMRQLGFATFTVCDFKLGWLREIQSDRPELTVDGKPKSFLGVQGPIDVTVDGTTGCQISMVIDDSSASRGGMEVGDIITALDDEPVGRFSEVRLMIAQKKPGDELKVRVRRGKRTIDLNIKLGSIETAPLR